MARLHTTHPRVSLHKQLANFASSCGGLDLILRLIQALVQIAAEVSFGHATVKRCLRAKSQLALGRRYLRLFSFIDCFERARNVFAGDFVSGEGIIKSVELVESSCLGVYLLMENLTILHDMDIWLVSWYRPILIEANRYWVIAICASIIRIVGMLVYGSAEQGKAQNGHADTDKKKGEPGRPSPSQPCLSTVSLLKQLVISCCDLTLPLSFLGWISLGDLGVGAAMAVSTVLAGGNKWSAVQQ